MDKDILKSKLAEYTEKLSKVSKALNEYEILAHKLEGAIEAINILIVELDKKEIKEE